MSNINSNESEFCLEGRFLEFVIKDGYKLKGLMVGTAEGECYVKLAKNLRAAFDLRLAPGTWLQIVGVKKYDSETGEIKFKAERVMASQGNKEIKEASSQVIVDDEIRPAKKAVILMCQKSDCMKRGGKALCQALEKELGSSNLSEQVIIKGTGCMKNCKAGPNLVMPDKTRYSRIDATQIPALVQKHFAAHQVSQSQDKKTTISIPATSSFAAT
jgi:NADH:ubiquinone oxidoreductase subunit E